MCFEGRRNSTTKKTTEQFKKELEIINPNIEVLGEYINALTQILCKCKIDGYKWTPIPSNLLNKNSGCPMCSGLVKKTTEQFIKELEKINPNIEVLGKYINSKTPIACRCKIDRYEWKNTPSHLLGGQGCPKCNNSKGEKAIEKYLDEHNIEFIPQYKFDNCKFYKELPFDFYLPNENITIEYDGEQHFKIVEHFGGLDKFVITKIRDTIKTIYCKDNNIRLIRIPYWEFDNIEKILDKLLDRK